MNYKYILLVIVLVAIMYFTTIRPQTKASAKKQIGLEKLKIGDRIITMGGFYATIVEKNTVDYIIAMEPDNVRMKISPRAIAVFPDEIQKAREAEKRAHEEQAQKG